MTQVAYGQKGYLGSSMSVRAVEAYEQGEMPISRWTKTAREAGYLQRHRNAEIGKISNRSS